jgi:hypothetical protein
MPWVLLVFRIWAQTVPWTLKPPASKVMLEYGPELVALSEINNPVPNILYKMT